MNTLLARPRFHAMAVVALAAIVFAGFARTYYLVFLFDDPPLTRAVHLHGLIATAWVMLHYIQAKLIGAHRIALHKRLGIAGAGVAAVLALQAISVAIANAADGGAPPGRDPLQFLSVPLGATFMFVGFVGTALALRRKPEWHKRLMLLGTMTLLVPAIARIDKMIMVPLGSTRTMLLPLLGTAAVLLWACAHDKRHRGSVHPAYIIGGALLLLSIPARRALGMTDAWIPIARWLVS